jgi:hypothetical protein
VRAGILREIRETPRDIPRISCSWNFRVVCLSGMVTEPGLRKVPVTHKRIERYIPSLHKPSVNRAVFFRIYSKEGWEIYDRHLPFHLILNEGRNYTAENTENNKKNSAKSLQVEILRIMFVSESNNP